MSFDPSPDDIADRYADTRARIVTLLAGATPQDLATPVPGTPKWTVQELLSHLVGVPVDMVNGRLEGAGGDAWTQRQVDERVGRTLEDLLTEWEGVAPSAAAAIKAGKVPAPVTFDIVTHESDLRGALGLPAPPEPRAIRFVTDGFGARATTVVERAGLPPLRLCATDTDWSAGSAGGVTAAASEYEWARAMTGRRSGGQVAGYDWSGDPAPYLDLLCPFGPLRSTDCTG